jgi:hypothetical protein
MLVLVEEAAESVSSEDAKLIESVWFGDRLGDPARHPQTGEHHCDPRVGEDGAEPVGELPVPVSDQEPYRESGVLKVHDKFRGAWVTHEPVGYAVAPRTRIRRV